MGIKSIVLKKGETIRYSWFVLIKKIMNKEEKN